MSTLAGKHVLLGITGGIAAYKLPFLVRLLRAQEAEVRVLMTPAATSFVTPLTLAALSGQPVHHHLVEEEPGQTQGGQLDHQHQLRQQLRCRVCV